MKFSDRANSIYADLHCHTNSSDGVLSPIQLVSKAEKSGLSVISITDHDTTEAHVILRSAEYNGPVKVLTGIEISCMEGDHEIHLLGYGINPESVELTKYIKLFRDDRDGRATEILSRLRFLGVRISINEVYDTAGSAPIGRPHIASVLIANGYASDISDAFIKYLDKRAPAYVPRRQYTLTEGVDLIHIAGGIAIVAHPGKDYFEPAALLRLLKSRVDGIEAWHPSHSEQTTRFYQTLARQHKLHVTGGSDFHGTKPNDERTFGAIGLTREAFHALNLVFDQVTSRERIANDA